MDDCFFSRFQAQGIRRRGRDKKRTKQQQLVSTNRGGLRWTSQPRIEAKCAGCKRGEGLLRAGNRDIETVHVTYQVVLLLFFFFFLLRLFIFLAIDVCSSSRRPQKPDIPPNLVGDGWRWRLDG
ncbi:hypothetical protein TRV_00268 [Trichophyton verrucosum HKI 0517]|uniref:Uncharacterized protein n=1 Tax=Trichophyton verrucosum (strain HKI 0517) TaxID=663202 RepID=D4CZM6_TRIVH|nr:uncharacterized protein TRV_00268 [Trichophyton verrucosum HKI 0517]EFE44895.1 hypothetical protein TRV_00268 [Trichophyton verrucosum HKI 0517]